MHLHVAGTSPHAKRDTANNNDKIKIDIILNFFIFPPFKISFQGIRLWSSDTD